MRKNGLAIGIVVAFILAGAGVWIATFDANRYTGIVQSQLEGRLVRKVSLGKVKLGLFPPRFSVKDFVIAEDPSFGGQIPFVQAQQLDVSVRLWSLFGGNVEIESLDLKQPKVELIKNPQGRWNFASLGGSRGGIAPSGATGRSARMFTLAKLEAFDGLVAVTGLRNRASRAVYNHIDALVRDFVPERPVSVDISASMPGAGNRQVRLWGQLGPLVEEWIGATNFQGTLEFKQVEIEALDKYLDSRSLSELNGVVSGSMSIGSKSGAIEAKGKVEIKNPQIAGIVLGHLLTADCDIREDLASGVITIVDASLLLGATPNLLSGTIDTNPTPLRIDLRLKAGNVSISEAAGLLAAAGVKLSPGTTVMGRVSGNVRAQGAADKPAFSGSIAGSDIEIGGKDLPQPVRVKSIDLNFTPGEIRSGNFSFSSGGATFAAQFALRQYLSPSPSVDATVRASQAALADMLAMAKAYGITALDAIRGDGTLNINLRVKGTLSSLKSSEILRTLSGTSEIDFHDMRYTGVDLGYQLATIGGFWNGNEEDRRFTNILRMNGSIAIQNGVAQSNDLLAQLDIGSAAASGTVNLLTQNLDLRVTAILSKEFSKRVGGAGVAGYLKAVLANDQGELVIPAIVTGTFQSPKFAPDLRRVAQMKLKRLIPNSSNPLAGIVGSLLGQKSAAQAQQQQTPQPAPGNPVQQLIDIFGTRKKQQ